MAPNHAHKLLIALLLEDPENKMIADSHCHAWRRWPYDKSVPDPDHRGSLEALLYEMDTHGVTRASVVCARIGDGAGGDGFGNEDNNDYVASFAKKFPDRISAWVDVDCVWRKDHHKPGAVARLREELSRNNAKGFTHYVTAENDGWFHTNEGQEFFATAAELKVVASMAISPAWFPDLREIAKANPTLPFLVHHMSMPANSNAGYSKNDIAELVKSAEVPNIGIKISGFNYNSIEKYDFPYKQSQELFKTIYDAYGADRLYWASDFPASRDMLTYTQAIEVVRTHCDYLPKADLDKIMGDNLNNLLNNPVFSK
jgi:predicted TIM-barrel fold metal-dependent hydrolase